MVFVNSLMFVTGFSAIFIALGVAAGLLGTRLNASLPIITRVAGVLVILFGLHMIGFFKIPVLYRDTRSQGSSVRGPLGSLLMGLAFAAGWSPCVGPILAGILVLAANRETVMQATVLLVAYSLGMAIPFLLTALAVNKFLSIMNQFKAHLHKIEVGAGVLLVGIGLLIVTNNLTLLNRLLPDVSAFLPEPKIEAPKVSKATTSATEASSAPDMSFTDLDGNTIQLSSFRGRVLALDFWATWCVPCREEVPIFNELNQKFAEKGLQILAVAVDSDDAAIRKFIKDYGVRYKVAVGSAEQSSQFDPFPGLPKTILIDRSGRVRAKHLGFTPREDLEKEIEKLLTE